MLEIFETLKKILVDQFQVDEDLVKLESTLTDLGLDSLTLMEFIFAAEDAFDLRIPEARLGQDMSAITLQKVCSEIDALVK
jgi:acyl carrier protein